MAVRRQDKITSLFILIIPFLCLFLSLVSIMRRQGRRERERRKGRREVEERGGEAEKERGSRSLHIGAISEDDER